MTHDERLRHRQSKGRAKGLTENDRIIVAFDNLNAEDDLKTQLVCGRKLRRQTLRGKRRASFCHKAGCLNVADQRIEARRQAETTNLNAQRDSANRLLRDAKEDRSRRQFKNASRSGAGKPSRSPMP